MSTKTKKRFLLLFLLVITLIFAVYLYPLHMKLPSGGDSFQYMRTVNWINTHGEIPSAYQELDYGNHAYSQPFILVLLSVFSQVTGMTEIEDLIFPGFEIFQVILLLIFGMSFYLLGSLVNRRVGFLSMFLVIASYSVIRLYMGAGMANLTSIALVNLLIYIIYAHIIKDNKARHWFLLFFLLVALYWAHKYFTFPLFGLVMMSVGLVYLARYPGKFKKWLEKMGSLLMKYWHLCLMVVVVVCAVGILLYLKYLPMVQEIWQVLVVPSSNRFMETVPLWNYDNYVGLPVFYLGLLGMLGVIFKAMKQKKWPKFYLLFGLIWIVYCFLLSLVNHLGVNFYMERFVYQMGIMMILFAALFLDTLVTWLKNKRLGMIIVVVMLCWSVIYGTNQIWILKDSSTWWLDRQIETYKYVNSITEDGEAILTNFNTLSPGYDYYFVPERRVYRGVLNEFAKDDTPERLFNFLNEKGIKHVLFTSPDRIGGNNPVLRFLKNEYYFEKIFDNGVGLIFEYRYLGNL